MNPTNTCTGQATLDGDPLPRAMVYSIDPRTKDIHDVTLTDSEGVYELPLHDSMHVTLVREYRYEDLRPPYGPHPIGWGRE